MLNNTVIVLFLMGLGYLFFGLMYSCLIAVSQIAMGNYLYSSIMGAIALIHGIVLYLGFKGINQNA